MWKSTKMYQKHKKTNEMTIINFSLRPMKLRQVKGYFIAHMHITFSKGICNWQLFNKSLMFQMKKHQFKAQNVLFTILANAVWVKE